MRILHISDIHSDNQRWEWLFAQARKRVADLYIVSGDFIDGSLYVPIAQQIATQREFLGAFGALPGRPKLVVCSGNHDERVPQDIGRGSSFETWLSKFSAPGLTRDGQILKFMGYTVESVGYGSLPMISGPRAIVVTHVPPDGCEVAIQRSANVSFGDEHLREQLLDADLFEVGYVFSGHVHRPRCWHARVGSAVCFNPGQGDTIPNHILVDLTVGRATWNGTKGAKEQIVL